LNIISLVILNYADFYNFLTQKPPLFQDVPHIYKVGNEAYTRLCRELGHINQCIIVSGESGSGKVCIFRYIIHGVPIKTSYNHLW
jgi:myosin heavy subunit